VLNEQFPGWRRLRIHESSPEPRGLSTQLAARCPRYTPTQYYPAAAPGEVVNGFRNENLAAQTFPDASFDLVISMDVMEHVNEPDRCLQEIWRTLKPRGAYLFTAPTYKENVKSERAARFFADGRVEHYREPEYHGNPIDLAGALVTFRYGYDLPELIHAWAPFDVRVYRFHDHTHGVIGEFTEVYLCERTATRAADPSRG
jgi:SAM-dependent methyltransferase